MPFDIDIIVSFCQGKKEREKEAKKEKNIMEKG